MIERNFETRHRFEDHKSSLARFFYPAVALLLAGAVVVSACETPDTESAQNGEGATQNGDGTAQTVTLTEIWSLDDGLDMPESAIYNADENVIYVSNIAGSPSDQDGNGYISKVSPEGEMVEEQWVTGLDAPKGMALLDGTLYVSDIDELVAIDVSNGEITGRYPAEGAQFLNDVAAGEGGIVYVTDSGTGRIHRLDGEEFSVWVDDPRVQSPNGIHLLDGTIVVAAADSTAEEPGQERYLRTLSADGSRIEALGSSEPIGGLDAVEPDGRGGLFLSDWGGAKVMHVVPGDSVRTLVELTQGTADLEYVPESQMVYLPVMMAGRLVAFEASWDAVGSEGMD